MKKTWSIFRTLGFIIVGLFNTLFIKPEDLGTFKNYLGYLLLVIGIVDTVFLIRNHLKAKKSFH